MSDEFETTLSDEDMVDLLRNVADQTTPQMAKSMMQAGLLLVGEIDRSILERAETTTGAAGLRGSWDASFVTKDRKSIAVGVFSDLSYAQIQDEGGTVVARNVRNLAIPNKWDPSVKIRRGQWPRHMQKARPGSIGGLYFHKGKKAAVLMWQTGTERDPARDKVYFILKRSVKIPGLDYLKPAVEKMEKEIDSIFGDQFDGQFHRAGFK